LTDPQFKTGTSEADQQLLKSLIVFACIMEGLFFYVGFVQILAMGRQNKMMGAAEQYQYIRAMSRCTAIWHRPDQPDQDGNRSCGLGVPRRNRGLIQKGWNRVPLRRGHHATRRSGLNAPMFKEYCAAVNRRAQQIGLDPLFLAPPIRFRGCRRWSISKEKNFETRGIEYRRAGPELGLIRGPERFL
jgi:ribonucleoside-diphosphate reductase beta chain